MQAGAADSTACAPHFTPDPSARVAKVNTKELEAAILAAHAPEGVPLVIVFYADWCGPCKVLGRTVERMAIALCKATTFVKVNVEEEKRLADDLEIDELPTVVFVPPDKYRASTRTEGMLPASTILECLQEDTGLDVPKDWTGFEHLPPVDFRDK